MKDSILIENISETQLESIHNIVHNWIKYLNQTYISNISNKNIIGYCIRNQNFSLKRNNIIEYIIEQTLYYVTLDWSMSQQQIVRKSMVSILTEETIIYRYNPDYSNLQDINWYLSEIYTSLVSLLLLLMYSEYF